MMDRPLAKIDDELSARESLRHLLRTVPTDADTYSSCEKALQDLLRYERDHLVLKQDGTRCKSISLARSSRQWIGTRRAQRGAPSSKMDAGHEWQLDLSRSKRSVLLLLGALVTFALIGLGFFANREEDSPRTASAVTFWSAQHE